MKKEKIIVVDDEENIRQTLQGILTDEGYSAVTASGGEEALRMIQTETPDLVLLDIWIPGIDGIQTLKIIKNVDPEIEVVMMTGHGAIDTAVKATKFGAFDFIEKPFTIDFLLSTVAKAVKARKTRKLHAMEAAEAPLPKRQFIGSSRSAEESRQRIMEASENDNAVILSGEPGLGKKFAAKTIHNMSDRRDRPFVEVACGALTQKEFSEVFIENRVGSASRFLLADGGTLFFDQIDQVKPQLLQKLLSILQKGAFVPKGRKREVEFDVRVMASTRPVSEETSRIDDLAMRLGATVISLTPLRERKKDIPEYISHLVEELSDEYGKQIESVNPQGVKILSSMPWEGNLTELKEKLSLVVERCSGTEITKSDIEEAVKSSHDRMSGKTAKEKKQLQLLETGTKPSSKSKGKKTGRRQRTLKNSVVLCGHGLHSGIKTGLILSPLPSGSGIIFGDISSGARVPATLDFVTSTDYATSLSDGHVTIKTIEHIMSALSSYGITNLLIKIGDEAPIMDGSAKDFCDLIEDSGVVDQDASIEDIVIEEPISVGDPENGPGIIVTPSRTFSIKYYLDYPSPIGAQECEYRYRSGTHYKEKIAPARTFGFLKDIKALNDAGLASGGKLDNVVLIDDEKIVNTPLRFPDEPTRHKILDLIGDLYLLGRPIRGSFVARKSGHTQNIALIEKINQTLLSSQSNARKKRLYAGSR